MTPWEQDWQVVAGLARAAWDFALASALTALLAGVTAWWKKETWNIDS